MTKAIAILLTALALLFPAQSLAASSSYATGDRGATATTEQRLTLVILPAVESVLLNETTETTQTAITKTLTIGVWANTEWSLSSQSFSNGFVDGAACFTDGDIGESNTSDSAQIVQVVCTQPRSWADNEQAIFSIGYTVSSGLGL